MKAEEEEEVLVKTGNVKEHKLFELKTVYFMLLMLMSFWPDIKTVFSNFSPLGCFIWTIILPTWL